MPSINDQLTEIYYWTKVSVGVNIFVSALNASTDVRGAQSAHTHTEGKSLRRSHERAAMRYEHRGKDSGEWNADAAIPATLMLGRRAV
jgi:hypothetical protein